jgi:hypothetical protein
MIFLACKMHPLVILAGAILKFILHGTAIDQNFNLFVKEYFSNK